MIKIRPFLNLPEICVGDDIVALLRGYDYYPGDVLVITSKIVSKSLGLYRDLTQVTPSQEAVRLAAQTRKDARLVELVLQESTAIIRAVPHVLITRHHCGAVMANAGIDQSNTGNTQAAQVLVLPRDPDAEAQKIFNALGAHAPAIIISDSFGRPWRMGVTNVALGAAGMPALVDRRGTRDRNGRILEVTQIALADQIASAAGLVMGEGAEGIPVALVRGLSWDAPHVPAAGLIRPQAEDLFA